MASSPATKAPKVKRVRFPFRRKNSRERRHIRYLQWYIPAILLAALFMFYEILVTI